MVYLTVLLNKAKLNASDKYQDSNTLFWKEKLVKHQMEITGKIKKPEQQKWIKIHKMNTNHEL